MSSLAVQVQPWKPGGFTMVRAIQGAPRNHGKVDEMRFEGKLVAVKRMPNWWVTESFENFESKYPKEVERPWHDLGIAAALRQRGFAHTCELLGIFRDNNLTYTVSELATHGDLFSWSIEAPAPGPAREGVVRAMASQLCAAVRWLHNLGVAHSDLSLENVLLIGAPSSSADSFQLKVIDFAMAKIGRLQDTALKSQTGKKFYAAPELHVAAAPGQQEAAVFDAFLVDEFALGVLLYALALADYPWSSTQKGESNNFEFARRFGADRFLERRSLRGSPLTGLLSKGLLRLLGGLLSSEPEQRLTVGEDCYPEARASVWGVMYLDDTEATSSARACQVQKCVSTGSVSTIMSEGGGAASDSEAEAA
jgi:serine/threonine protein kinase